MWVIPVRYDPERPVIIECIKAIQRTHDKPKILVVDSASPDRSYFDECLDLGVRIAAINNIGYGHGAFGWAWRHYSEEPYWHLIYDSLIVTGNTDHLRDQPLTVMRHWSNSQHDWGWDENGTHLSEWGGKQLESMGLNIPDSYFGIMGPMMFCQSSVMTQLDKLGFWFLKVRSKYEVCAMERVQGIVLGSVLGYDIPRCSLQGIHTRHEDPYDESVVRKLDMARM